MNTITEETTHDPEVVLDDDEAELVVAEATVAARLLDADRAAAAERLASCAQQGVIPAELTDTFAEIATASIEGGRARKLYRAEGEKLLNNVLGRTPAGKRAQADLDAVNAALRALAGRNLESVRVARRAPGQLVIRVATDELTLALDVSHGGVAIESVTL